MAGALGTPAYTAAQNNGQKMTLRRFVRVTIDNFRQLLQTMSAPTNGLPMPQILPSMVEYPLPPSGSSKAANAANAAPSVNTDTGVFNGTAFGNDSLGDQPMGDEQVGEAQVGDDLLGEQTLGDDLPDNGAVGAGAPDDPAPVADASGSDVPGSPAHPLTRSPFHLPAALESLLFVCDEAVEATRLATALGIAPAEAEAALLALDAAYRQEGRGLRLQVRNGRYQLVTAPEAANLIENFLNLDTGARLSAPALETLAVAAYRQPVTRAQIEAVRGVDCSGVLRSLLSRGLLEEVGRLDAPGRPVLYGVTDLFMHHFGLTALHELPPLDDAELARIDEVGA